MCGKQTPYAEGTEVSQSIQGFEFSVSSVGSPCALCYPATLYSIDSATRIEALTVYFFSAAVRFR
jgi:hypothetical protein